MYNRLVYLSPIFYSIFTDTMPDLPDIKSNSTKWKGTGSSSQTHRYAYKEWREDQSSTGAKSGLLTLTKETAKQTAKPKAELAGSLRYRGMYHKNCLRLCFNTSYHRQIIPLPLMPSFLSYYSKSQLFEIGYICLKMWISDLNLLQNGHLQELMGRSHF